MTMNRILASFALAAAALPAPAQSTFKASIERLDPALDSLIDKEAAIELLATGFKWSEGPVWLGDRIVFSDVPNNTAFQWKDGDKEATVFVKPSGSTRDANGQGSNGLAHDASGRLILCQHGDRCIARRETDGSFTKLCDQFDGKRFNSPNDLVIDSKGIIYFTDPPYGLPKDQKPETDVHGVYAFGPSGKAVRLIDDIRYPNGIALSPDENTLYIAVSDPANTRIMAYSLSGTALADQGAIIRKATAGHEFFNAQKLKAPDRKGGCDGMKVDAGGNIWTTGPGGVLIVSKEGRHLGTILTGQPTANCAFGGDGSVLYITSNMNLLRVRTKTKGTGFH